ncbi:DUF3592 domain-containing protein [Ruminococcus albus]|uniref:DUF3592 domain-containing protein n=1 Tax=Ruminococcus albus TaxID=1264 RepID=A0A1I1D9X4_RUMAL|nr:DUF3592 domain-containing protein [Ruminococcus albus]SFB71819.1 Protein of unknown function [Ruminococcus albus]
MSRRSTKPEPGIMIFMGIIMIIMALIFFVTGSNAQKMHKRCTQSTNGTVQTVTRQMKTSQSGKYSRSTYYVYLTAYTFDVNGKAYSGSSTLSSGEKVDIGTSIKVYYNPSAPSDEHYTTYDDSGKGSMICSVLLTLFGVVFIVIGIRNTASRKGMKSVPEMAACAVITSINGQKYNYGQYDDHNDFYR